MLLNHNILRSNNHLLISFKFEQFSKHPILNLVIESGNFIFLKLLHLSKHLSPILVIELGNFIFLKLLHSLKHLSSNLLHLFKSSSTVFYVLNNIL